MKPLALGTVGLGMVVMRNVLERRSELALLRAVGFSRRRTRWLVLAEHGVLLGLGTVCGVVAAAVAVIPSMRSSASAGAFNPLLSTMTLIAVIASGFMWTAVATMAALRGPMLESLRYE